MNSFVFVTFIYFMQASCGVAAANTVPVFMLDYEQVMIHVQIDPNPFAKLTSAAFAEIIHDSAKRSAGVIIFVEETFSAEDISTKDREYGTPYKNLRASLITNKDKVKYLPSVIEPYKILKQIFPPRKNNVFVLSQRSKLQLQDNFKYIYIFFQDGVSESRADVLQRHDAIIKKVVDAVRQLKPGPVIAYYTGKSNPIVVKKVEFVKSAPIVTARKSGIFIVSPRALFRLFGVNMATPTRRAEFNQPPTISEETYTRHELTTRFAFSEFELEWNFNFKDDGWVLSKVSIYEANEEVGSTILNVESQYNTSYFCPEPIRIVNSRDGSTVTIDQIHIEPRVNGSSAKFSPSRHCAPYFSAGILAALTVTFLCLAITMYGIMSIGDVSANDRFDDPNGQPLSHEVGHIEV